jgi:hypothetical protein
MTLADYARHRNVTKMAVSKAVLSGRLSERTPDHEGCIERDDKGRRYIADVALADREWESGRRAPPPPPRDRGPDRPAAERPCRTERIFGKPPAGVPTLAASIALKEAAVARKEIARAEMAEFDVAKRRGQLLLKEQALGDLRDALVVAKTRFLGIPARFAQQCPQYAKAVVPVLTKLVHEALEDLARIADQ